MYQNVANVVNPLQPRVIVR